MRDIVVVILLLGIVYTSYGQRRYAADRYFKEYAYSKSADLYQDLYDKGDRTYVVLSRLGDSYYFNSNFKNSERYYSELMSQYENIATGEHIFRYAQSLKSNGKIIESDSWLLKLKSLDEYNSSVLSLEQNRNYFHEYSNRPKTYISIHNLSINTSYSDFSGFSSQGYFYFSSTRKGFDNKKLYKWNNQPYLNIYRSKEDRLVEGKVLDVGAAEKVESLSSKYHESGAVLSKDGEVLYFTKDNSDGSKQEVAKLKIYKTKKQQNGNWGSIEELPFNSDDYSVGHPALSPDGSTLYFVSDMPGGYGATDLYKVSINSDGSYGTVKNLGSQLNTEGREMFPFVGNNNRLYYASDGLLGLGALDVFESEITQDTYGAPVNLGSPINGPYDDFGFLINDSKNAGYFTSNREGGKGDDDIYSFRIYSCKEDIRGIVSESGSGKPLSGVSVSLIDKSGKPVSKQDTGSDGAYSFTGIDCEHRYVVVASKDAYKGFQEDQLTLDVNKKVLEKNLVLEPLIVEDEIIVNPIYYNFDKATIREDATYELEKVVGVMKAYPSMVIRIEAHTDSRGSDEYNLALSKKRAISAKDYILSRGISPDRIASTEGFGETQLVNDCNDENAIFCTNKQHQENRRTLFIIVEKGNPKNN